MIMQIGFMQGRLSPTIDGKIQAFPVHNWKQEFVDAKQININLMEWTLDYCDLELNPLMLESGRDEIRRLSKIYEVQIPSVTGDCFMQSPFWKIGKDAETLKQQFMQVSIACSKLNASTLVVPLVDKGKIENDDEESILVNFMLEKSDLLSKYKVKIAIETDYTPSKVRSLISRLPSETFGINYDMGNSASLGYDPVEEFKEYGSRIINVHVKDRVLGGSTVALQEGNVKFRKIFKLLKEYNYRGNLILQTARCKSGKHVEAIHKYKELVEKFKASE